MSVFLLLPRGCRLVLQALASRIKVQNAGCPPPSFDVQQPQLDNTRASLMFAAADTHNKAKVGCVSCTLGGVKLGAIIDESHRRRSLPTRLVGGAVARCLPSPRTRPRDPAIWVWRSLCRSTTLLQTYLGPSGMIPHQLPLALIFLQSFCFLEKKVGRKGGRCRYSPLSLMSFATLVGELHNLYLGQCGLKPM